MLSTLLWIFFLGIFIISNYTDFSVSDLNKSNINLFAALVIWILFDFTRVLFQLVEEYHQVSLCDLYLGLFYPDLFHFTLLSLVPIKVLKQISVGIPLSKTYSTSLDTFYQWFVGFTDGEACFSIVPKKDIKGKINRFTFMFSIGLHKSIRTFSVLNKGKGIRLSPYWVTGFSDAEGSFMIEIERQPTRIGWRVKAIFSIHLHSKDLPLLHMIQRYFGGIGFIHVAKTGKSVSFKVTKLDDLVNVIIPHFKAYPLRSAKSIDFGLWLQCVKLMENKEHLTEDGLNKIISLKSALNLGLSENLQAAFPRHVVVPIERPAYSVSEAPLDPDWICGFTEGDGSFFVSISSKTNQVRIFYQIGLNDRETPLVQKIQEFFGGIGNISFESKRSVVKYIVVNVKDIRNIILPHFDTYDLIENKLRNYLIWREILLLVYSKAHQTREGLIQIKDLRSKLNK